jgi:hypothetical protein
VETKETEGLGVVDRKANDSTDMKRGGRRIPHSDLQLKDFSLESLTNFPENLRRFEREHGAAWDRDFFDKNIRFALMSRWLAWPGKELNSNDTYTTCSTPVLTRFFDYLKAHHFPQHPTLTTSTG